MFNTRLEYAVEYQAEQRIVYLPGVGNLGSSVRCAYHLLRGVQPPI